VLYQCRVDSFSARNGGVSPRLSDEPSRFRALLAKEEKGRVLRQLLASLPANEIAVFQKVWPAPFLSSLGMVYGGAMSNAYVHGYDPRENQRLQDQASTLVELLHADTAYPAGSRVLEAGCGVGSQTVTLASKSPGAIITSIDISAASVAAARKAVEAAGIRNVTFQQADIFHLPFPPQSFDHVFVCFVLEHLTQPVEALRVLKQMVEPGGTITVIEGDHGSTYFYPESAYAQRAIQCQVDLQARAGGNALIGRQLYPLLHAAGFYDVHVSPRMVYVDGSKPALIDGFTKRTFTVMIEGVRPTALEAKLMSAADFDRGIADLYRTAEADGVFCYTFFKATAVN